ncbi:sulfopyruvate decarboxylase subunit beta [Candidatus Methanoperedens nitratireducens]|uniref:sulfopyruvate decarboxylase n=1 Tax=Candidatus Methanoperedens nitratireducens TaxID=1392998 RepID=A0A284VJD9_9EURY|nr:sulfopyruvate decarboxylase subunit beta [Candidatus Methanoperedens nitroreducens]SNQ59371.1 Sulfopyruvate decarboxylase [Candidatus Methanoperedens nitroreducens]
MESPEQKVVKILKDNSIDIAVTLPCDRIKVLLPLISRSIQTIPLTREENGVGICAGVYLGGKKPVMVIQSTGTGNMINALLSLNLTYDIPLPVLASWRGVYKESIEAQVQLGKRMPAILDAAGIKFTKIESKDELDKIDLVIKDAFNNARPHVALISPAVWEGSSKEVPAPCEITSRPSVFDFNSEIRMPAMSRYDAIKVLTSVVDDIILSNLGIPSKELYTIKDRELNFYMLGSMGLVSAIGLGLALVQERHVYVIDGDGSLLMNPNALTAVGAYNPRNLCIIAVDNAAYGSTGNQETCTRTQIDLELLARASGIKDTVKVHTEEELSDALLRRVEFIHVIVKPENAVCKEIPLSAREIKGRFVKEIRKGRAILND